MSRLEHMIELRAVIVLPSASVLKGTESTPDVASVLPTVN